MDKKKKKTIIAIVLNVVAVITIIIMMRSDSTPEMLVKTGKDLSGKLIPVILKGDFFKDSTASLTLKDVKYLKMKKQKYRVMIRYDVTGDKDIKGVSLQLEGKIEDGKFKYTSVNQGYTYADGTGEVIKFDPNKDKALIIN